MFQADGCENDLQMHFDMRFSAESDRDKINVIAKFLWHVDLRMRLLISAKLVLVAQC